MTYYIYHIPGKKIGVTRDLKKRVEEQQGYGPDEYDIVMKSDNIDFISEQEIYLQKQYGYRVDDEPYNELKFNNTDMNINITEQTTTFPCPINKLKGQLMDNIDMKWETEHGDCTITNESIKWIMKNVVTSKYNDQRCYVYNKAFARWFDNNNAYRSHDKLGGNLEDAHMQDQYNGKTITGALAPTGIRCKQPDCENETLFDCIRDWAEQRGLYNQGDPKTQTLKLMEEAGEICRAVLKKDEPEIIDGIGDCVVVLTNLAHLCGTSIEECIEAAYNEIKDRKGKMDNGTFKKD
jgi:NTP pyrophosphatase (non-canonical NTP hydrolase)